MKIIMNKFAHILSSKSFDEIEREFHHDDQIGNKVEYSLKQIKISDIIMSAEGIKEATELLVWKARMELTVLFIHNDVGEEFEEIAICKHAEERGRLIPEYRPSVMAGTRNGRTRNNVNQPFESLNQKLLRENMILSSTVFEKHETALRLNAKSYANLLSELKSAIRFNCVQYLGFQELEMVDPHSTIKSEYPFFISNVDINTKGR